MCSCVCVRAGRLISPPSVRPRVATCAAPAPRACHVCWFVCGDLISRRRVWCWVVGVWVTSLCEVESESQSLMLPRTHAAAGTWGPSAPASGLREHEHVLKYRPYAPVRAGRAKVHVQKNERMNERVWPLPYALKCPDCTCSAEAVLRTTVCTQRAYTPLVIFH